MAWMMKQQPASNGHTEPRRPSLPEQPALHTVSGTCLPVSQCQRFPAFLPEDEEGCAARQRLQIETNGGWLICRQLFAFCWHHATHCQKNKCPVLFCLNIKHRLQQQQVQHQSQQAQLHHRRMASVQGTGVAGQHAGDRCGRPACRGQVWQDSMQRIGVAGQHAGDRYGGTAAGSVVPNACYSTV